MNIDEFKIELVKLELLCSNDTIPDSFLEEFILTNFPLVNIENSTPFDIFSKTTLDMLLERGTMQLNNIDSGRIGFIRDGKFIDLSHYRDIYLTLFYAWQNRRWITIENSEPNNYLITFVVNQ